MSLESSVRANKDKRALDGNMPQLLEKNSPHIGNPSIDTSSRGKDHLRNENHDKTSNESLDKLDKQFADLKRKYKGGSCSSSPRKVLKTHNTGTDHQFGNMSSPFKLNGATAVRCHSAGSSISSPSPHKHQKSISRSQLKSTLSSSLGSTGNKNSVVNNDFKTRLVRTKSDIAVLDTQVIDGSLYSSFMKKADIQNGDSNDSPSRSPMRPTKADSVNMFDSIPNNRENNDDESGSVEIPDSSESYKAENKENTQVYDHMFSSPIKSIVKHKKQVVFSSDIESSMILSSPVKPSSALTRRKSILKSPVDYEQDTLSQQTIEDILKLDLGKNESWPSGFVLLIPLEYSDLARVVLQCSKGLIAADFKKHYQVYASFNDLLKRCPKTLSSTVFTKEVVDNIVTSVKLEIKPVVQELKDGLSPFKLRTTSQALKLVAALSVLIPEIEEMSYIYSTCLRLLKNENLTKSLATPIFQVIKNIPEAHSERVEALTIALIQMKFFQSCSVICEKLNIIRKYTTDFPALLNKCNYQVLSYVLYSIINTDVPGYSKILFSAVSLLTCISRNSESKSVIVKLLSEELEPSFSSIQSTFLQQSMKSLSDMNISDALCETLKYLIHVQLYTQAAKIWSYVVYMVSYNRKKFSLQNWTLFYQFQSVFNQLNINANSCALSLEAWKSVVYNFQMLSIDNLSEDQLRSTLDHLLHPFTRTNLPGNWTEHQGYVLLYCRVFYAVHLRMEEIKNEGKLHVLLECILKPLLQLKNWDSTLQFIMQMMFASDRYVYNASADSCFWLSDLEKWRSRIIPLPKNMHKSRKLYETILSLADISINSENNELLQKFLEHSILYSLDTLKLGKTRKDYLEMATYITRAFLSWVKERKGFDADVCFQLIKSIDEEVLFSKFDGGDYELINFINSIKIKDAMHLPDFIKSCKKRFDELKVFAICLLSDIYNDSTMFTLFQDEKIPCFLGTAEDLKELELARNFKLSENEQRRMVESMLNMFRFTLNEGNLETKYAELMSCIKNSNLLLVLKTEFKYDLLLDLQVCCGNNRKLFCSATSADFLDDAFEYKEENLETGNQLIKVVQYFKDFEEISEEWLILIGTKLNYLFHPEIILEEWILRLIKKIVAVTPIKYVNKLKKTYLKRGMNNPELLTILSPVETEPTNQSSNVQEAILGVNDDTLELDSGSGKEESGNGSIKEGNSATSLRIPSTQVIEHSDSLIGNGQVALLDADTTFSVEDEEKVEGNNSIEETLSDFDDSLIVESFDSLNDNDNDNGEAEAKMKEEVIEDITDDESNNHEHEVIQISPARRTRSQTSVLEFEILDEKKVKKLKKLHRQKKRREKRERKQNRESSVERDELDQFRSLLNLMNMKDIKIEKPEREDLEKDLVTLLMKLKQS